MRMWIWCILRSWEPHIWCCWRGVGIVDACILWHFPPKVRLWFIWWFTKNHPTTGFHVLVISWKLCQDIWKYSIRCCRVQMLHHNVIPHTCIISAFLLTNVARAGDVAQLLRARARSDDDPGDQMQPAIYCWLRAVSANREPGHLGQPILASHTRAP